MKNEGQGRQNRVTRESQNHSSMADVALGGLHAYQQERAQSREMIYWLMRTAMIAVSIAAAIIAYEVRGVVERMKAPQAVPAKTMSSGAGMEPENREPEPARNTITRPLMGEIAREGSKNEVEPSLPPMMEIEEERREGHVRERVRNSMQTPEAGVIPIRVENVW